jgi:hypothetical protein
MFDRLQFKFLTVRNFRLLAISKRGANISLA